MFVKIYKAYKFRLYPNDIQAELINKTLGCTRFVYNYYLDKKKKLYSESKTKMSCFQCIKDIKELNKEYLWLKEADSMALRCVLFDLDNAFKKSFQGSGYPKFKSRNNPKNAYRTNFVNDNIRIDLLNKIVRLPKLKYIKISGYRNLKNLDGRIINATVSKESNGKYYVSVLIEEEIYSEERIPTSIVGIDLGIKDIVVTSNGEKYANDKVMSKYEQRIKRYQRQLSKKVKKSNNYQKLKTKIAVLYSKMNNARKHITHKITNSLIKQNDIIVTEKLHIQNMMRNHKLAKSISDVIWDEIIRQLQYKCEWHNKNIYQIDSYYPSSKECSVCGHKNEKVSDLSIRSYECEECGNYHDRDINASINIMFEGIKLYMKEM